MQDEHPPLGQGPAKLCLRPATACDPAFRSGHFRLKVPLLSGSHGQNITLASKMSCPTTNFAKGSNKNLITHKFQPQLTGDRATEESAQRHERVEEPDQRVGSGG